MTLARLPFIATGVLGCLALFGCGLLIGGRWVGAIGRRAADRSTPCYRLHAHRAMSDVPCEAFMIAALGLGLWGASRIWSGRGLGTGPAAVRRGRGLFAGSSIVCKLNGLLAPMILAPGAGSACSSPGSAAPGRRLGLAGGAAALRSVTMVVDGRSRSTRP